MLRKIMLAVGLSALAASAASAADVAVLKKAPAIAAFPYDTAGVYAGIGTDLSAAKYNVNVPELGPQSLTANGGSLNATLGYSFPLSRGANFGALQCSAGWQNIGGQQANLISLSGPVSISCFAKFGGPFEQLLTLVPNLIPTGALPTFAPPANVTITDHHLYGALGGRANDISASVAGVASNSAWSGAFAARIGTIWRTKDKGAIDTFVEFDGKGKSFSVDSGRFNLTPAISGAEHTWRAGVDWLL